MEKMSHKIELTGMVAANNFITVRFITTEVLYPGEFVSFTINQNSGSGKTLVQDFQNFFNITAIQV